MAGEKMQDRTATVAWEGRNGVVFVPHYSDPKVFVGPGNTLHARERLIRGGAHPVVLMLWPRGRQK